MQKRMALRIKLTGIMLVLVASTLSFVSFKAKKMYADIWQQLGITREKGLKNMDATFLNGYFHYYGAEKAKNILTGNRAAVAKDLLNYTKQQINSDGFKKQYDKWRMDGKPEEPTEKVRTKEEIRKEKIAETEKSIKDSEKTIKELPDMAKVMSGLMEILKNNLKDYKDPNSKTIDMYYQNEVYDAESRMKSYRERMKKWELEYPADYKQMVKKRLVEFVTLAKTVDFNAELKDVKGKKKFVNPTYEGKSYNWKMIFRAGKEVIEPSILFAEQWIKEIG